MIGGKPNWPPPPLPRIGSKEYLAVNDAHIDDPQPGDYWQEMFCPVLVVLGRIAGRALVCTKTKSAGSDKWCWDLDHVELMTPDDMRKKFSYGSIPGYWCDVLPGAHKDVVEYFKSLTE